MRFVLLLFIITGCGHFDNALRNDAAAAKAATGKLIPIDFNDTLYAMAVDAVDTVTSDGWKITYLVKDDATRYNDLYIQWEKDAVKRVYNCTDVLLMRPYFIPALSKDNTTHIFLEHGCATDCRAVLVLPKNSRDTSKDFEAVLDYNADLGQVVYREGYDEGILKVAATCLSSYKTKWVTFKNKYGYAGNPVIDTIVHKGDKIMLYGKFSDRYGHPVTETKSIEFE